MLRTDPRKRATIGFRVKSGWASAVLLTGPMDAPVVRRVDIVELSDPKVSGSKQPYHNGMFVARKDGPELERLLASVATYSQRSLAALLRSYIAAGYRLSRAGLVVGSNCDPAVITNPHIRVHAAEGRLFRTVIEDVLTSIGVDSSIFIERTLFAQAAGALVREPARLKEKVMQLRPAEAARWRTEEKTATLAAWLVLALRAHRKSGA
jgi:hypothetical protein